MRARDEERRGPEIVEQFLPNLRRLEEADRALVRKIEELGAFYLPELYEEVNRCHIAAEFEINRLKNLPGDRIRNRLLGDDGIRNHNEFGTCYSRASQIIRDRLLKLAVLPGSR